MDPTFEQSTQRHSTSTLTVAGSHNEKIERGMDHDIERQKQENWKRTRTCFALKEVRIEDASPLNFPNWKKAVILSIICTCCLCVTCSSSVISTSFDNIQRDLGVSQEVSILSLSLFVLGLAFSPPLMAPFSEIYGRRPIYLISFTFFFLLSFPVAFANNITVLCIFRFLTGFCGSAFLNVAGGTISDMWTSDETYIPLALYTAASFLGPVVGPVYGSFISQFSTQWRWSLWSITIWSFVDLCCLVAFAPETFAPVILRKQVQQSCKTRGCLAHDETQTETHSLSSSIGTNIYKIPVLLFHESMLLILCIWIGLLLGIIYAFFLLFPIVFSLKGLNTYQTGLCFLGFMISNLLALGTMPFFRKRILDRRDPATGYTPPEAQLECAKLGCFLSPIGLFIFAFTSYKDVPWIGAVLGSSVYSMGSYYLFFSIYMYTTSNWRSVAASAMGANSMVRCFIAAAFPLFTVQMANGLTNTGAGALLAGVNCLMIPVPFILTRYGAQLRARSKHTY